GGAGQILGAVELAGGQRLAPFLEHCLRVAARLAGHRGPGVRDLRRDGVVLGGGDGGRWRGGYRGPQQGGRGPPPAPIPCVEHHGLLTQTREARTSDPAFVRLLAERGLVPGSAAHAVNAPADTARAESGP